MKLLFIENRYKTYFFEPIAQRLKSEGHDIYWIIQNKLLILQVPSAVNPNEMNYLINVAHPGFNKIKLKKTYPFKIDDRLLR